MSWKAITRYVPGSRHLKARSPCQDYGGDRILDQVVMGAVADGAGSASHAEIGAQVAVRTILDYLEASEHWLNEHHSSWQTLPQAAVEKLAREFFTKSVGRVQQALRQHIQSHPQLQSCTLDDFACTLLAFVATPAWIAAMQIGDGFIVVRLKDQTYQLLFNPDKGDYANQTTFVTSSTALSSLQTRVVLGSQHFICAATDGLEPVAIRRADTTPFPPFFQPLEEFVDEADDPNHDDRYLVDFLQSERLNQRTDDDKTLLLCLNTPT